MGGRYLKAQPRSCHIRCSGALVLWSSTPLRHLQDTVRGFLANHQNCASNEETRYAREYRGVDNPQSFCAVDREIAGKHPAGTARPDGATAGCVVAPSIVADKAGQRIIADQVPAGIFLVADQAGSPEPGGDLADKPDT